jgi:hypothetical protein
MTGMTRRPPSAGRVLVGAVMLAWSISVAVPASATGDSARQTTAETPASSAIVGAGVTSRNGASVQDATADFEARLGYRLGGHRLYSTDFTLPADVLDDDAVHGRISYLSIKPPGGSTDWRSFASTGRKQMDDLASQLGDITADGSHRVVIALQHEPDVGAKASINRADFRDMQTQFFSAMRAAAPRVTTQIIFGGYKLFAGQLTQAQMAEYLPVDRSLVDVIGTDSFGDNETTLAQIATPMLDFAAVQEKPLALDEVGVRAFNCDRTAWVNDALTWIKSQPRIDAVLWFESNVGADPALGYDPHRDFWLEGDGMIDRDVDTFNSWKFITAGDPYWVRSSAK